MRASPAVTEPPCGRLSTVPGAALPALQPLRAARSPVRFAHRLPRPAHNAKPGRTTPSPLLLCQAILGNYEVSALLAIEYVMLNPVTVQSPGL
jgi:hypothetical protein